MCELWTNAMLTYVACNAKYYHGEIFYVQVMVVRKKLVGYKTLKCLFFVMYVQCIALVCCQYHGKICNSIPLKWVKIALECSCDDVLFQNFPGEDAPVPLYNHSAYTLILVKLRPWWRIIQNLQFNL